MKSVLFLVFIVMGGSAFADLIPFEVIRPMPLHRIGIDILAEVVGALAVGGLAIKQLVAKYEKMKKSEVQDIEGERQRCASGGITIAAGGEFVRIAEPEVLREDDASEVLHVSRWRELEADERQALESKLDREMHVFESIYDKVSGAWLREADLPSQWTSKRGEWWNRKCKELVFSTLLRDDKLRDRLKGVPIEWVVKRMDKPTKRTWLELVLWQMDRYDVLDFVSWMGSSEFRECLRTHREHGSFWSWKKIEGKRRQTKHRMWFAIVVAYLLGVIVMALGVVEVSAPDVAMKVAKIVSYPLMPVIGISVILFVSWVAWGLVLIPLNCWYREKKAKRISERRAKFFSAYRGERKWRIPVSDITPSRQQMQLSSSVGVIGVVGSAQDASLRLTYPGVALHHAEIYFDKAYHALGGHGFVMRGQGRSWVGEYIEGRLSKKEKTVYLNVGREICMGPYAVLKVVSTPVDEDNAFVFELVDGRRHEEKTTKVPWPDTSAVQHESSGDNVPFACDDVRQNPFVVEGHVGIVLGRSSSSDIRLVEPDVSARHVGIVREGDQIFAVCLSRQGMFVNDMAVEPSVRRQLHEGDCMRIGMKTEVRIIRLPKDGDDVMVLNVTDSHGAREEEVRLPIVAEGASRRSVAVEDSGHGCGEDTQHSLGETRSASPEELAELRAHLCVMRKPVIYLYPEKETTCNAKVITDGALTRTYPAHGTEGWRDFVAAPDGTLTFPDGRKFYCLYWEGTTSIRWDFSQGYCVKGADTAAFLGEALARMGLSFREANEFIIYWLPHMQDNPYNVIAFQRERYAESAKLEIEPRPDSILRVFMAWKASDCPVDIPAPDIRPFERRGFTVVEWGGTEVEDEIIG